MYPFGYWKNSEKHINTFTTLITSTLINRQLNTHKPTDIKHKNTFITQNIKLDI